MKFERLSGSIVSVHEEENEPIESSLTPTVSSTQTPEQSPYRQRRNNYNKYFRRNIPNRFNDKRCFVLVVVAVILILFIILGFVVLMSLSGRCDEKKLIECSRRGKNIKNLSKSLQEDELKREEDYKAQRIEWIPYKQFQPNMLKQMEPAGNERYGKHVLLLYVSRTNHINGIVVGKYCPYFETMYFGYSGVEIDEENEFEILMYPIGTLSWLPGDIIDKINETNLIVGGKAPISGEKTFICRTMYQGYLLIGKYFKSSSDICQAAYRHEEHNHSPFEILAVNEMGKMLRVNQ